MSENYISEPMKLGNVDFKEEMNENFFKILFFEAGKGAQFLDNRIFILFNDILNRDDDEVEVKEVLKILHEYSSTYIIPADTRKVLETIFPMFLYSETVFKILYNIIVEHHISVKNKTLDSAIEHCIFSDDDAQTFRLSRLIRRSQ